MRNLVIFCLSLTLLTIFVFGNQNINNIDNGNFAFPSGVVTGDPDGEFIPDCSRCERLRLVGCRRSEYSIKNNSSQSLTMFYPLNQQVNVIIVVLEPAEIPMEQHTMRQSSLLFQAVDNVLQSCDCHMINYVLDTNP